MIRFRLYDGPGDGCSSNYKVERLSVTKALTQPGESALRFEIQADLIEPLTFTAPIYSATLEHISLSELKQLHESIGRLLAVFEDRMPEPETSIS